MTKRSPRTQRRRPRSARASTPPAGSARAGRRDGTRRDAEIEGLALKAGAPRRPLSAAALSPMLAHTAERPFSRRGWVFELKYDGIRALIVRDDDRPPSILARSGRDVTATFPEIAAAAAQLPLGRFVIDGELIALDRRGTGSFELLQQRLGLTNRHAVARAAATVPVHVYAFDLLAAAGYDLRGLPLLTRKAMLRRVMPARGAIRYVDHVEDDGAGLFDAACQHGVEGVVAKRGDSTYASGRRSRDWVKIKAPKHAKLAVVGFLPGKGARAPLGALMLAWRRADRFVHAGNVGSGLSEGVIAALLPRLRAARRPTPAFDSAEILPRNAVYVEPAVVAEVRFTEATERGLLRQPVFLRLCGDTPVAECDSGVAAQAEESDERVETPGRCGAVPVDSPQPAPAPRAKRTSVRVKQPAERFTPSNLDKIFWPADGYTKGDLLEYYDRIWPAMAPYLRDRPLVLTRYPDGIDGKNFFQKNAPDFIPDWIPTCRIDGTEYFLCNERDALRYIINLGCIPIHIWSARRQSIDRPDWAILDLDPKDAPFRSVLTVARRIHALLDPLGAPHFIKTSGQSGLHVLIPLNGHLTHDEAKSFAEVLAHLIVAELPDIATVVRPLRGRGGRVYVDFLQNGFGKTIVAPFSVRPRPGAPVSTPLEWPEVTSRLDPAAHTIRTVPKRLRTRGDPMHGVLGTSADVGAILTQLRHAL